MIGVILQARMGSSRLPGKVLKEINGMTSIEFQINRIKKAKNINKIILATTTESVDDPIEKLCQKHDILFFRGSEQDVLARYYDCAKAHELSSIVRLTADCPLVDPSVIDLVITSYLEKNVDYCSNTVPPETSKWPDGSDVEVFSFEILELAYKNASEEADREHVTFYFWKKNFDKFNTYQLPNHKNWANYRFTVDHPEDYDAVRLIVDQFYQNNQPNFDTRDIINFLDSQPEIKALNNKFSFGEGWKE